MNISSPANTPSPENPSDSSNMQRFFVLLGALGISILIHSSAASGQSDVCEPDRAKFCPGYIASNPMKVYCLKRYESQVKPSCKSMLRNVPGTEEELYEECAEDYARVCRNIVPGKGRALKCLKKNSRQLSLECNKKVTVLPNPE